MEKTLSYASNFLLVLGGIATTLMMLHIGADIVGKYFFNYPIPATLEIVAWYYMVAAIFFPVAYVQLHRKHLMVELFTQKMSANRVAALEVVTASISLLYIGTLFFLTLQTAIKETANGEAQDATFFDLAVWPSRWILPIALGVMAIIVVFQIWQNLNATRDKPQGTEFGRK